MSKINWISVTGSSQITAQAYDLKNKRLFLKFTKGDAYAYEQFPEEKYTEMINAESIGKYFHKNIKGSFTYSKITNG